MTESTLDALYLPSRTPLAPAVRASLREWSTKAVSEPPSPAAISLWLGLMSADPVGIIAAEYALGWILLGWRNPLAWASWQRIEITAGSLMPSADYLAWQADQRELRILPMFPTPRARWQTPQMLRREARVIAILRGGSIGAR